MDTINFLSRQLRKKNLLSCIGFIFLISKPPVYSEEKIISCEILGGLGNQLFQISTTLATAWNHDYEPIFPALDESPSLMTPRPVYWDTIFRTINKKPEYLFHNFKKYPETTERAYSPFLLQDPHVKLLGYWQSAKYFEPYRQRLLDLFQLPPLLQEYVHERFQSLILDHKGPVISVHLRLGDYLIIDGFMHLWKDEFKHYYTKALSCFPEDALFLVFSDDLPYAQDFFAKNFPLKKVGFPKEMDYVELYLMAKCDHNIIANSTFSWWGAYLNNNQKKIVISPKEWTVTEGKGVYYRDYLLDDWITISVFD